MKFPSLTELNTSREIIDTFGGYNHNLRIGDGEFYDMKNLTSADYPVLSPRPKRGVYPSVDNPQGLIAKDTLSYVDGADFVINDYRVNMGLSVAENDCPKTLLSMGAYVIIMPDKKYINTADVTDFGNIEATVETTSDVSFELCKLDGSAYSEAYKGDAAPESPENMDLWIDTSSTPHTLKQYSSTSANWTAIATTYIKITSVGLGKPFEVGDGVTISGIEIDALKDLNSTMVIWEKGDDYIVVIGMLDSIQTTTTPITVTRRMPNLDFIIESENRLWGCRYGYAVNGEVVNEIYASKLGDFKNWNSFAGVSTDSYVATVGTDGQFTGAVTHLGYPIFFKENCMHKVYGNYPANYQIQTTACRGVQRGCNKSLAIVNETLYYKSRSAVCAYDGSLPVEISAPLGEVNYSDAVAGVLGNKYYISMADGNGVSHLFVYDTHRGLWHREDNTKVKDFCNCRGELYYIDSGNKIKTVIGKGDAVEQGDVEWMAETGIIGLDSPDKKYVSRIDIRLSMTVGARVFVHIQYDSGGDWEQVYAMTGINLRSFAIPIRPKRCDHIRIRISGWGESKIYSICKTIEQGSDI